MTKGVKVLCFFLSFSVAKKFLVDVEDETLKDETLEDDALEDDALEDDTLEDSDGLAGNDYGNTI